MQHDCKQSRCVQSNGETIITWTARSGYVFVTYLNCSKLKPLCDGCNPRGCRRLSDGGRRLGVKARHPEVFRGFFKLATEQISNSQLREKFSMVPTRNCRNISCRARWAPLKFSMVPTHNCRNISCRARWAPLLKHRFLTRVRSGRRPSS